MDLEVVGRHALLFDDDAAATFVNSGDALVDWNSLLIDRYDVRHLLSAPPPPRNRRTHTPPDGFSADAEIEHERYLDLQAAIEKEEADVDAKSVEASGYHSVAFSYGNPVDTNDQNNYGDEMGDSSFQPPFYVPENLLQCLPPTEKVHQIIARTALFVAKNGSQSEIVLRVKQGDNPTFGFLMPDHHLHPYFRYLIDNQDLWKSDSVEKSENEKKETSAALSLLGSVYGSGDDEDVATDNVSKSNENETRNIPHATISSVGHGFQETKLLPEVNDKKEEVLKQANSQKEDTQVSNKNPVMKVSKAGIPNSKRKEGHLSLPSTTLNKPSFSASVNASKVEPVIIEPPSDIKRLVDKVVEFILKNGPQFETVLTEQDSRNGRFPFLLHSNQFHPYYANVLQKAQEAKSSGKSSRLDKKLSLGKESDSLSSGQASGDIPYDYNRKEKFKMVLGKTKNDSDDPSTKNAPSSSMITINAAQAAAILRAGTRGVNNSNVIPNLSLNGEIKEPSVSIAANEANSNEDHMTKEQKLKAERLKRAKMFVSMLKSGAAPSKSETPRGLSVEPQEAVVSGVERESSVTLDIKTSVREDESERKLFTNEIHERMSKRKYRSKSSRYEEDETIEENEDGDGEKGKEKNEKHSKKKHRSHKSLRESEKEIEDDVGREYRDSKRKHQSHRSSLKNGTEEDDDTEGSVAYKHDKKRHRSRRSSRKNGTDEEEGDEEDRDYRHDKRKHRSREKSRKGKELEYDEEDREYRDEKRKLRTHRSSRENGTDEENGDDDRDCRHGKRKHQSHHEKSKELEDDEEDNEYRDEKRKLKTHRSSRENGTEEEDDEDRDYRHGKRKHRSHREKSKESEDDEEDREHGDYKRKLRSHRSLRENDSEEEDDGEEGRDRDYRHGKRKHRSHRSSHENGKEVEDDEEDRNYRRSKRKRRSRHSLRENNIEEEDDDEDRDPKHGKNKHRSRSTSRQDENDDDKRGHKKGSKKHRSYYYSSDEDEENDYPEKSKKKHKSHCSSRRKRIRHKHKEHDSSSEDTKSLNLKMHEKSPSHQGQPDLEEGEISSKNSDESRRNVRAGARREVSIDVSSSYQEREPSQTVEATQVPDDLRAKIRAMLMENL